MSFTFKEIKEFIKDAFYQFDKTAAFGSHYAKRGLKLKVVSLRENEYDPNKSAIDNVDVFVGWSDNTEFQFETGEEYMCVILGVAAGKLTEKSTLDDITPVFFGGAISTDYVLGYDDEEEDFYDKTMTLYDEIKIVQNAEKIDKAGNLTYKQDLVVADRENINRMLNEASLLLEMPDDELKKHQDEIEQLVSDIGWEIENLLMTNNINIDVYDSIKEDVKALMDEIEERLK